MGLTFTYNHGQTQLDEDEKDGLLVKTISTRAELDEFEQSNIEKAMLWVYSKRFTKQVVLSEGFVMQLHEKMYGQVWRWAGTFRKTNKNIGVDKHSIAVDLKQLLDDCNFWIENKTYTDDEIAIRFKHRLVSIHCFPNGNGRHSRLMADVIIEKLLKQKVFSWGMHMSKEENVRQKYLDALRAADKHDLISLIQFARQ